MLYVCCVKQVIMRQSADNALALALFLSAFIVLISLASMGWLEADDTVSPTKSPTMFSPPPPPPPAPTPPPPPTPAPTPDRSEWTYPVMYGADADGNFNCETAFVHSSWNCRKAADATECTLAHVARGSDGWPGSAGWAINLAAHPTVYAETIQNVGPAGHCAVSVKDSGGELGQIADWDMASRPDVFTQFFPLTIGDGTSTIACTGHDKICICVCEPA